MPLPDSYYHPVLKSYDATHFYCNGVLIDIPSIEYQLIRLSASRECHDLYVALSSLKNCARELAKGGTDYLNPMWAIERMKKSGIKF